MIRLGHIRYSNCYPIHEPFLGGRAEWLQLVEGSPAFLNELLARAELDVAPCSSIELARHPGEYRALRGLCIASDEAVESIAVVSRAPLEGLAGSRVALPTASATARVLLRILLELRHGIAPRWEDFDQEAEDPLMDSDVAAALFIGDIALRRLPGEGERRTDLGSEWFHWTGLPFVFALWQLRDEARSEPHLPELHRRMLAARDGLSRSADALARRAAGRFGIAASRLAAYWRGIRYTLDPPALRGLTRFYELAADLDEVAAVPRVRMWG
ncbi:MAG: menaquinone biosynthetic enzyme MqnA/MqnD family protein [Gemmatimonadota bacterium]